MNKKIIFSIVIVILIIIVFILHFFQLLEIDNIINVLILSITAWAIAMQSFATEEMAKNQIRPSVDVSMIFNKEKSGTLFQFLNITKIPTLVWIIISIKDKDGKEIKIEDDYLSGRKYIDIDAKDWLTAPGFLKELTGKNELLAVLKIEIAPMFNEKERHFFQKKSYRFDPKTKEWLRTPFWLVSENIEPGFFKFYIENKESK